MLQVIRLCAVAEKPELSRTLVCCDHRVENTLRHLCRITLSCCFFKLLHEGQSTVLCLDARTTAPRIVVGTEDPPLAPHLCLMEATEFNLHTHAPSSIGRVQQTH